MKKPQRQQLAQKKEIPADFIPIAKTRHLPDGSKTKGIDVSTHCIVVGINKKVLGEEHPDTARSLNNLAILCFDENKIKEAAKYMRKALAIYRKAFGDDHPDTKTMMGKLEAIERKLR